MSITDIIYTVIAGGLLGALGQGIRIAVGLKKLSDSNAQKAARADQNDPPEPISASRLWVSIFLGFVAGAIGMIIKGATIKDANGYQTEAIITIIAIGYAGSDFIEGFFNTYMSKVTAIAKAPVTIEANPPVKVSVGQPVTDPKPLASEVTQVIMADIRGSSAAVASDDEPELVTDEYKPEHNNAQG